MTNEKNTRVLPSGRLRATFPVEEIQGVAEKLFAKAGFPPPGQGSKVETGMGGNPRNRSEAKWAIEKAMDSAVTFYSSPENLQSLSDDLKYLLPRYGVNFGDEDGPLDEKTQQAMDNKYKEVLKDPAAHAIYTNLLTKIYDGSVDRLQKVAAKTGNRSILQMGDLEVDQNGKASPQEVTPIGQVPKLQDAYRDAVKRDQNYMYELVVGEDGKSKIIKKKAPGTTDWMKDTAGGIMATGSTDEALGYLMGSSVRALFRLLPGFVGAGFRREVEKSTDIRAEQAKVLEHIGELSKGKDGIVQPHVGAEKTAGGAEERGRAKSQGEGAVGGGHKSSYKDSEVIDVEVEFLEDRPKSQPKGERGPQPLPRGKEGRLLLEGARGKDRD